MGSAQLPSPSLHRLRWLLRGCCCLSSGSAFISKRWRLQALSPAAGCGAAGKGCMPCAGLVGGSEPRRAGKGPAVGSPSPGFSALRTLFSKSCCPQT